MTPRDLTALLAIALAGCGGGAASASIGTTAASQPSRPASASQFVAAIDAALAAHPDARVFEVEIDDTHRIGFLEVEYFAGEEAREIFFDPGTMEIDSEQAEVLAPGDAEIHAEVRAHLEAGEGDLRAFLETGALDDHAIETVQEIELTILEGHYVVAIELLTDGARSTVYHSHDGSGLGGRDEALAVFRMAASP